MKSSRSVTSLLTSEGDVEQEHDDDRALTNQLAGTHTDIKCSTAALLLLG